MISAIELNHFWFRGRRKLVISLLKRFTSSRIARLLDIGCGTGFNLQYWGKFSDQAIGLDRLSALFTHHQKTGESTQSVVSDVCKLPILNGSIDVAVALDVLEHVPDENMLSEINRSLVDGGLFIATVPAMEWLWSSRDESAGHLRRYSKQTLRSVLENSGFEIVYLGYYQCILFPLLWFSRAIGRSNESACEAEENPGRLANVILNWITQFEVALTQLGVHFPWGSTLVTVVRKTQSHE